MKESRPGSPVAEAAVIGGAVTRERLRQAALCEGRADSALVRALLAQPLPGFADLVKAWGCGGAVRLEAALIQTSARAARLLDPHLLRRERCVPVEIYDDICVLAVEAKHAARAVEAIRALLNRCVLPVEADSAAIDAALAAFPVPAKAKFRGPIHRRDPAVHARFRDLVLGGTVLDAIRLTERRG